MKIIVEAALKQEEIITILTESTEVAIRFIGRSSTNKMIMEFEAESTEGEKTVALVKAKVKAAPWGKMVYFIVHQ